MRIEKLRISDIRYNPEREGFEALVSVHDGGLAWRYPAFIAAPLHAEFELISRRLSQVAIAAHRSAEPGMRMHLRPLVKPRPVEAPDLPFAA